MSIMQAGSTTNILVSTGGAQETFKFSRDAIVRAGSDANGKYFTYYESANNNTAKNKLKLSKTEYEALKKLDADGNGVIEKADYYILKSKNSKYVDQDSCEGLHLTLPIGNPADKKSFDVIF